MSNLPSKSRPKEDVLKDIKYVRNWETALVAQLSVNEVYSFFETNKASERVRGIIYRAVEDLQKLRSEYETETGVKQ